MAYSLCMSLLDAATVFTHYGNAKQISGYIVAKRLGKTNLAPRILLADFCFFV